MGRGRPATSVDATSAPRTDRAGFSIRTARSPTCSAGRAFRQGRGLPGPAAPSAMTGRSVPAGRSDRRPPSARNRAEGRGLSWPSDEASAFTEEFEVRGPQWPARPPGRGEQRTWRARTARPQWTGSRRRRPRGRARAGAGAGSHGHGKPRRLPVPSGLAGSTPRARARPAGQPKGVWANATGSSRTVGRAARSGPRGRGPVARTVNDAARPWPAWSWPPTPRRCPLGRSSSLPRSRAMATRSSEELAARTRPLAPQLGAVYPALAQRGRGSDRAFDNEVARPTASPKQA